VLKKQVRDYDKTFSAWDAILRHLRRKEPSDRCAFFVEELSDEQISAIERAKVPPHTPS
jgi:hypothetical protein